MLTPAQTVVNSISLHVHFILSMMTRKFKYEIVSLNNKEKWHDIHDQGSNRAKLAILTDSKGSPLSPPTITVTLAYHVVSVSSCDSLYSLGRNSTKTKNQLQRIIIAF